MRTRHRGAVKTVQSDPRATFTSLIVCLYLLDSRSPYTYSSNQADVMPQLTCNAATYHVWYMKSNGFLEAQNFRLGGLLAVPPTKGEKRCPDIHVPLCKISQQSAALPPRYLSPDIKNTQQTMYPSILRMAVIKEERSNFYGCFPASSLETATVSVFPYMQPTV